MIFITFQSPIHIFQHLFSRKTTMQDFQYIDLIRHYLSGQMTPEELAQFEAQLKQNTDLADELVEISALQEGFDALDQQAISTPERRAELARWADQARNADTTTDVPSASPSTAPMRVQYVRRWMLAAAAVAALVVAVWRLYPSKELDVQAYLDKSTTQSTVFAPIAGMNYDSTSVQSQVKRMFDAKRYADIVAFVAAQPDSVVISDEVRFFEALSLAKTQPPQLDSAARTLERLAGDPSVFQIIRLRAGYEAALCHLQRGDRKAAAAILQRIAHEPLEDPSFAIIQNDAKTFLNHLSR
jgi:hypothetical protein